MDVASWIALAIAGAGLVVVIVLLAVALRQGAWKEQPPKVSRAEGRAMKVLLVVSVLGLAFSFFTGQWDWMGFLIAGLFAAECVLAIVFAVLDERSRRRGRAVVGIGR